MKMGVFRNEHGVVVDDLTFEPVSKLIVSDAGDNVLKEGTPAQLEVLQRLYARGLREGKYTLIGMP
jgi:hypothetical protein